MPVRVLCAAGLGLALAGPAGAQEFELVFPYPPEQLGIVFDACGVVDDTIFGSHLRQAGIPSAQLIEVSSTYEADKGTKVSVTGEIVWTAGEATSREPYRCIWDQASGDVSIFAFGLLHRSNVPPPAQGQGAAGPEGGPDQPTAQAGDPTDAQALYDLGYAHYYGEGVPQDAAEAARLFRLAAEQGYVHAQNFLGYLHDHGEGVPHDDAEAVRWYRLAADQGDPIARANLAYMYENGLGVPQDYAEAARLYRLSADQGDAVALTNLGFFYENGHSVPQDYAEAARLYRLGAQAGDPQGEWNLGGLYALGRGVPQDLAQAAKLRLSAFAQGNAWARSLLIDERGSRLGVEERREMQRVLQSRGLYSGPLDGEFSPAVIAALEAFAPG